MPTTRLSRLSAPSISLILGTNETIRCGAVVGNTIGVPYASSVTVGVGVGAKVAPVVLPPQAASSMRKESRNNRQKRVEMTWERIVLNLRDIETPAVTSRGIEIDSRDDVRVWLC